MNILVVDDEPLIHLSIEKLILASSEDCQVSHAYNGQQMLELLKSQRFQLAYVDIKMPGLTGLEAIRLAKETSPSTLYYIMTGFDEFEYAKQAVKLKAEDYLMKPLDQKTIWETIQTAKALEYSTLREKKTVFRNWLENVINHRKGFLGKYEGYYGFLILIAIDHAEPPAKFLSKQLQPYEGYFVSVLAGNQILLRCFSEDPEPLHRMSKELSVQSLADGVSFFASTVTRSSDELAGDLQKLLSYSCLRVAKGSSRFYYLKPLLASSRELLDFCSLCVRWQTACFQQNYSEFTNCSEQICRQLEQDLSLTACQNEIHRFFRRTLDSQSPLPMDTAQLRGVFLEHARGFIHASGNDRPAQAIIQYIQEHYCENLSIAGLAEQFGFSANYVSSLLKQELGISYNKYITQLRLNRAKELLLATRKSVKEITEICGYYSQSHFTKLFMEHEGCTPAEFRKGSGQ